MPAADLTLIININSALSMSLGFFNGPLLRMFGYRKVSVVASLLFALGLILTSMADTVFGFIITYGVITGTHAFLFASSGERTLSSGERKISETHGSRSHTTNLISSPFIIMIASILCQKFLL